MSEQSEKRVVDGPVLVVLSGPSPTREEETYTMPAGPLNMIKAAGRAGEHYKHSPASLLQMLHRQVMTARNAHERSSWFGGRFYNACSGDNPDYITMAGAHLRPVLLAAKIEPPEFMTSEGQYGLRYDIAETALAQIHAQVAASQT